MQRVCVLRSRVPTQGWTKAQAGVQAGPKDKMKQVYSLDSSNSEINVDGGMFMAVSAPANASALVVAAAAALLLLLRDRSSNHRLSHTRLDARGSLRTRAQYAWTTKMMRV